MTPEEEFLKWAATKDPEYVSGWVDGMSDCVNILRNLSKKVERKDSTSGAD